MFDLIVNGHRNTTRRDVASLVISWTVHALVIGAVVLLLLFFATGSLAGCPQGDVDLRHRRCTAATATSSPTGVAGDNGYKSSFTAARTDAAAAATGTGAGRS
jgi:hypothetical protein